MALVRSISASGKMRVFMKRALYFACLVILIHVGFMVLTFKQQKRVIPEEYKQNFMKSLQQEQDGTCTFQNCPTVKEGMINVHLIPHSHIDVGWTKSVDQYYTGEVAPGVWSTGCVRCILNSTIGELLKDPKRRFIFIESKYMARYWGELNEQQRQDLLRLNRERRFEIVNGGWVMSDAAVTMYNDIIDQHTLGFDWVRETFGPCGQARTAWHVDQFGHSREHASILAQMGFDSLFIGRIHTTDLDQRIKSKNLEIVWDTSPNNLKERATLFTDIIPGGYYSPDKFNFDSDYIYWSNPPDAEKAAKNFINIVQNKIASFKTNHLLLPMGCDFCFKYANKWFENMELLMKHVENVQKNTQEQKINLLYSTPSCYAYHVNKERQSFETKSDDFIPYAQEIGNYWTGFFTTRPGIKYHIKRGGQILQSCKQVSIFTGMNEAFWKVQKLRDAMGVMQHHDAITGTQRLAVHKDYQVILSAAIEECETVMSIAFGRLWKRISGGRGDGGSRDAGSRAGAGPTNIFNFCHNLNISACRASESNEEFVVSIYSPLSWPIRLNVRLPLTGSNVKVFGENEEPFPVQVVPVSEGIKNIPERQSAAVNEAVFQVNLPPMSLTSYRVLPGKVLTQPTFEQISSSEIVIENEHLSLTFNKDSGKLVSMLNKDINVTEPLSQDFAYYEIRTEGKYTSGPYIFMPTSTGKHAITTNPQIKLIKGETVQEVHQTFSNWAYQVVRLYKGSKFAEFQWVIGPLANNIGKEVVSYFTSGLKSGNKFYTDSNGREVLQRIREDNVTKVEDVIASNYYPITSRIYIQDIERDLQLTIMPDRVEGGSSLTSGALELMVHRNTPMDDDRGLSENLMDLGVNNNGIIFTGKHYVCLDKIGKSASLTRRMALQLHIAPTLMFSQMSFNTVNEPPPQVSITYQGENNTRH